jgi:RNA polymerase sigma-70 factor (ECF subfamily)
VIEEKTVAHEVIARAQSDEDVIASIQAGDHDLYENLVRRYGRFLHSMTLRVVHDDADADDLVQETHLKAFVNLGQFAGRSSFATWLTTIALHGAIAYARRPSYRLARNGGLRSIDDSEMSVATATLDPEQRVLDDEARRALRAAVAALPPNYRDVVIMRGMRELSTAETARQLGTTQQSVKMRLHRARTLLRTDLARRLATSRLGAGHEQGSQRTRRRRETRFGL